MTSRHTLRLVFFLWCLSKGLTLPSPENVIIDSVNLHSVLRWSPVWPAHNDSVKYTVQYRLLGTEEWQDVAGCSPTTETCCDFGRIVRSYVNVTLRVRAQAGNQTSPWYQAKPFVGRAQTQLNHPHFTLSAVDPHSLRVEIKHDETLKREFGDELKYRIFYGKDNETLTFYDDASYTTVISFLEVDVEYCVMVLYVIYPDMRLGNSPSKLQCATVKESEKDRQSRIILVSIIIVILSGVVLVVCSFLIYKNYPKIKYLLLSSDLHPTNLFEQYHVIHQPPFDDTCVTESYDKISLIIENGMEQER